MRNIDYISSFHGIKLRDAEARQEIETIKGDESVVGSIKNYISVLSNSLDAYNPIDDNDDSLELTWSSHKIKSEINKVSSISIIDETISVSPNKSYDYIITLPNINLTIGEGNNIGITISIFPLYECNILINGYTISLKQNELVSYKWNGNEWSSIVNHIFDSSSKLSVSAIAVTKELEKYVKKEDVLSALDDSSPNPVNSTAISSALSNKVTLSKVNNTEEFASIEKDPFTLYEVNEETPRIYGLADVEDEYVSKSSVWSSNKVDSLTKRIYATYSDNTIMFKLEDFTDGMWLLMFYNNESKCHAITSVVVYNNQFQSIINLYSNFPNNPYLTENTIEIVDSENISNPNSISFSIGVRF